MGACTCGSRISNEAIFKDFWDKIVLKNKPAKDWQTIISIKRDAKEKKLTDGKWMEIIDVMLVSDDKDVSVSLWRNAMKSSQEKGGEHLIVLACLFLVKKSSMDAKSSFISLASNYLKKFVVNEPTKTPQIKKEQMIEIITFYVNLISLFSVKEISSHAQNKKEFEAQMERIFSQQVQQFYISELMQPYKDDWVDLDKFFESQYMILTDDVKIRERLTAIYEVGLAKI
jgi:hypothetical protein